MRKLALLAGVAGMAAAANANIVINEVLGSTSGADAEFIELYNTSGAAVDIGGWGIELWDSDVGTSGYGGADGGSTYVIPAGTMLAAGDYYVLANGVFGTWYSTAVRDQLITDNAIENGSYTMILVDGGASPIDSVFVTDSATDTANRGGAAFAPGASFGPDGTFLPAGFYRFGDGSSTLALLEFDQPSPSATPGAANIPAPGALALLGLGGLVAGRRRRA